MLKQYPPDIILGRQDPPISERSYQTKIGWAYVYSDTTSILFLKETVLLGNDFISKLIQ